MTDDLPISGSPRLRFTRAELTAPGPPPAIDTSVPHSARIWNFWLGGKDNYPVDREGGEKLLETTQPGTILAAAANTLDFTRPVRSCCWAFWVMSATMARRGQSSAA